MIYVIHYEETSVMYYDVEADSKEQAVDIFDKKVRNGEIDFSDMEVIDTKTSVHLVKLTPVAVYPEMLKEYWRDFSDISIDEDYCIERPFMYWPKGTSRYDIWQWFDKRYPGGVVKLMEDA